MNNKNNPKQESVFKVFYPIILIVLVQFMVQLFAGQLYFFYKSYKYTSGTYEEFMNSYLTGLVGDKLNLTMSVLCGVILFVVFLMWYRHEIIHSAGVTLRSKCEFRGKFNYKIYLAMVLIGVGAGIFSEYVLEFVAQMRPEILLTYTDIKKQIDFASMSLSSTVLLIYVVVVSPIFVELAFRGLSLGFAERRMSFVAANIIQALLFSAVQMNLVQSVYAFCFGLVLGYVYYRTENILVPIIIHVIFNITAIALSSLALSELNMFVFFGIFFVGMVIVYLGIILVKDAKIKEAK